MTLKKLVSRASLPLFGALVSFSLLTGCGESSTDKQTAASETPKAEKPRVALVMKSLANEFFISMADGAKKHQAEHTGDYDIIVNGIRNESDLAQQVSLVEQVMATGVKVIVIAPADSKSLLPVVKRAQDQGIVVINIDNKFDQATLDKMGITIPFVGPDNREGAKMVGDYLAKDLTKGDEVAIIGGIPSAFNGQQRQAGFEDAMKEAEMTIVSTQAGDWEQAKAATVAAAMLSEHPNLKAILCANDSMALGAVAAVRQAGKEGQVKVVGFDNISAARDMIKNGSMLATADQFGDQLAVFGIEYALQVLNSGETPEDRKTEVKLITKESL